MAFILFFCATRNQIIVGKHRKAKIQLKTVRKPTSMDDHHDQFALFPSLIFSKQIHKCLLRVS